MAAQVEHPAESATDLSQQLSPEMQRSLSRASKSTGTCSHRKDDSASTHRDEEAWTPLKNAIWDFKWDYVPHLLNEVESKDRENFLRQPHAWNDDENDKCTVISYVVWMNPEDLDGGTKGHVIPDEKRLAVLKALVEAIPETERAKVINTPEGKYDLTILHWPLCWIITFVLMIDQ